MSLSKICHCEERCLSATPVPRSPAPDLRGFGENNLTHTPSLRADLWPPIFGGGKAISEKDTKEPLLEIASGCALAMTDGGYGIRTHYAFERRLPAPGLRGWRGTHLCSDCRKEVACPRVTGVERNPKGSSPRKKVLSLTGQIFTVDLDFMSGKGQRDG